MKRLAFTRTRGIIGLVAAALLVAVGLWASGVGGEVRGEETAMPVGVLDLQFGPLEGGRTYLFPDGSWLIDVPAGRRVCYCGIGGGATETSHSFTDLETGSHISIEAHSGKVHRSVVGDDTTATHAWLDRFEAGFRRPPDYVPPPTVIARYAPQFNADGIQILDNKGVFEGGRTYVIPGEPPRLLEAPAGIRFTYSQQRNTEGGRYHAFEAEDGSWHFWVHRETGYLLMWSRNKPDALRLADAVAAAYAEPSPGQ